MSRLRRLLKEVHQRSLWQLLASYVVGAWLVLQIAETLASLIGLPLWFGAGVIALLAFGLVLVLTTGLVQVAAAYRSDPDRSYSGLRRLFSWKHALIAGLVAVAVLVVGTGGYMGLRAMGIGPMGSLVAKGVLEERDPIVLADFEDQTGDTLAHTVTNLFRIKIGQSGAVRVTGNDYARRVLPQLANEPDLPLTYDLARELAIREGLKGLIAGEIDRLGSSYVLSVRLVAAETGETLESFVETAEERDAILSAIDRLSTRLRERVGESLRSVQNSPPLRRAWTTSLEAARLADQGGQANERGEFRLAVDLYSRALEIDTLFAGAYAGRALNLPMIGGDPKQRAADITRAYELRRSLPKAELYMVEGLYHYMTGDLRRSVDAYLMLLELEPEHPSARNLLGSAYAELGDYARAEQMWRAHVEVNPTDETAWRNLSTVLFNQGKVTEAWEVLRLLDAELPETPTTPLWRYYFASAQGDYDAARMYLERWRDLSPGEQASFELRMSHLALVEGKLAEAENHLKRFSQLRDNPVVYLEAGIELASRDLWLKGDTSRALEAVAATLASNPLDSIPPRLRPYYALATFYAFAGSPDRARELLAERETTVPPDSLIFQDDRVAREASRRAMQGVVALAEDRFEDAVAEFRFVSQRRPTSISGLPLLGRALELAGQPDSAIAAYERYLTTPYRRRADVSDLDPNWLPVVYARLGDLYEQRGDTTQAIHYYGELIDLWKDADPELQPRVEAARRAIEALSTDR